MEQVHSALAISGFAKKCLLVKTKIIASHYKKHGYNIGLASVNILSLSGRCVLRDREKGNYLRCWLVMAET